MTNKEAEEILMALACCSTSLLTCKQCPRHKDDRCESFTDKDVAEAVKVLQGSKTARKLTPKKAVEIFEKEYEGAVKNEHIHTPIAYAMYHAWRYCDAKEKKERMM